jgi:hypothetical protein
MCELPKTVFSYSLDVSTGRTGRIMRGITMVDFVSGYFYRLNLINPNTYQIFSQGPSGGNATGTTTNSTFEVGETVDRDGVNYTYLGHHAGGWIGQLDSAGSEGPETSYWLFNNDSTLGFTSFTATQESFTTCFLGGTLISCPDGERAVETLVPGELILGADGRPRVIRWVGRQSIVTAFADPLLNFPIKILAGALAENVPARDLFLSPGHALLIDGLLVHASALVNGMSITRVTHPEPRFTWFHIETEDHAVILAEGTPAETFVDNVSRERFDNYAEFEALFGRPKASIEELDQPRVKSARQLPTAIRDRLAARADALGLTFSSAA